MASAGPSPALKILVYSMGAMLVGGTILFLLLLGKKINDGALFEKSGKSQEVAGSSCSHNEISLPPHGKLRNAELKGQQLKLWFAGDDDTHQLLVVDSCSGMVVREVKIRLNTE